MSYSTYDGNTWTLAYRPGYPQYLGTDQEYKTVEVDLVDGSGQRIIVPPYFASTGVVAEPTVTYSGGTLAMVKYAQISITDYAVDSINLIVGTANVTCSNDASLPITVAPPPISGPTDPPGSGWRSVNPVPQGTE